MSTVKVYTLYMVDRIMNEEGFVVPAVALLSTSTSSAYLQRKKLEYEEDDKISMPKGIKRSYKIEESVVYDGLGNPLPASVIMMDDEDDEDDEGWEGKVEASSHEDSSPLDPSHYDMMKFRETALTLAVQAFGVKSELAQASYIKVADDFFDYIVLGV